MSDFAESKLKFEKMKYVVLCDCTCRVSFYPFENRTKKVCKWCGKIVYKNKKEQFKDMLLNQTKKNSLKEKYI